MTTICPRCRGNGYIKVKESIENQMETIHQCPQCNSQGEIMMDQARIKTLQAEQRKLTVEHIKKLETEIAKLMKQKAELQDQVDKYVDKEVNNGKV
jgi:predicted nuclease with TOPRIM domain